jgi:DNA invertase Pin-like site-specific DNA recombinase
MEWHVVAEYEDRESGAKGAKERPGFNALMEAASRREFDTLLVWSLDRFSTARIASSICTARSVSLLHAANGANRAEHSGASRCSSRMPAMLARTISLRDTRAPTRSSISRASLSRKTESSRDRIRLTLLLAGFMM